MFSRYLKTTVVAFTGLLMISSCSSSAHIEKMPGINLENFKTYSWAPGEEPAQKNRRKQMINQRIHAAVDAQLQKNGLTEVQSNPDVLISTDLMVEKSAQERNNPVYSQPYSRTFLNPYTGRLSSYYYPSQFIGYNSYKTNVKEGTVTVTLIDAKTDKTVWQGWATRQLTEKYVSDKDIDKNVQSIFKKFSKGS